MKTLSNKQFHGQFDRGACLQISDLTLEKCDFDHCTLSATKTVARRSTIERCFLRDTSVGGCDIGPAVLRDIEINGLKTSETLVVWGALFERVKLLGAIGAVKINRWVHFVDRSHAVQSPFDAERTRFYAQCDWAIDICEARFCLFECEGIPARLFRRDPETQVVVTRERALMSGWFQEFEGAFPEVAYYIESFIADGEDDFVLAAPLGAGKRKRDGFLAAIDELRRLGVANDS